MNAAMLESPAMVAFGEINVMSAMTTGPPSPASAPASSPASLASTFMAPGPTTERAYAGEGELTSADPPT